MSMGPGYLVSTGIFAGILDGGYGRLGYGGGAMVFASMLAGIAVAYSRTGISRTALFCAAFVLTRPLGAVVGDLLDKRIFLFSRKPAKQGH